MEKSMKNIGILIYTHNRVDDAKINMDIIRNVWGKNKFFENVTLIHCFNGEKEWHQKKYLEDELVIIKNSWHFRGAADLIDVGIKTFQKKYKKIDYVIVLAADTWLIKPTYVKNLLNKMEKNNQCLATCPWGFKEQNDLKDVGMAVDFFVVNLKWATKYKMFPINYSDFYKKYRELFLYQSGENIMLEKLVYARYLQAVSLQENYGGIPRKASVQKLLNIKDREPVHTHIDKKEFWIRNMHWPKMGLLTHHNPKTKKEILKKEKINSGKSIKKLLTNNDLSYYNNGVTIIKDNVN